MRNKFRFCCFFGAGTTNFDTKKINEGVSSSEITRGGIITEAGNAELFFTRDWRSTKPIFIKENCKQCMLCCPVCPDSSIPVDEEGNRMDFDYDHCKGCGVCAAVCPFNAIKMEDQN